MTTTFLILFIIAGWSVVSFALGIFVGRVLQIINETTLTHEEPVPPQRRKLRAVK